MVVRSLTCLFLVVLIGCTRDMRTAESNSISNTVISSVAPSETPTPASTPQPPVKPIGYFSNADGDGEHSWGFTVQLWRQGDRIFGSIGGSGHAELVGGSRPSILEDVRFDPKTRAFSFTAKLAPVIYSSGTTMPPDVYKFEGILTKSKLAGNQSILDGSCPETCIEKKKTTLPRYVKASAEMEESNDFGSYQDWKVYWEKIAWQAVED